jgi:2-oxoisovalerate ferredoxin oxidoreductase alpha subunit
VVYGALLGGATHFFGYPITPASEIAHAAAEYFVSTGRCFLQAEDEVNVVNMLYGRCRSTGHDSILRAGDFPYGEGISYMAEQNCRLLS